MPPDLPTTAGTLISVNDILMTSTTLAGLTTFNQSTGPMVAQYVPRGLKFLTSVLRELAAEGPFRRVMNFHEVTLLGDSSTYKYELPETVLEVHDFGMYIPPGEDTERASGESRIEQISRAQWHGLTEHASESVPTQMFVNQADLPSEVWFWPIPNAAGTVRLQVQEFSYDAKTGKDIDLLPHWYSFLHYELAAWFADATNQRERSMSYRMTAREKKQYAKSFSNQQTGGQIRLGRLSGWGSR